MSNKHIKKCSISLAIREMQIKTMTRYHHIPSRTAKIKNSDNTNVGKDAEKLELSYIAGGNVQSLRKIVVS